MKITKCDLCGKMEREAWSMNLIPSDFRASLSRDLCEDCARKLKLYLSEEARGKASRGQLHMPDATES